jgi:molecular chaperone GrpE
MMAEEKEQQDDPHAMDSPVTPEDAGSARSESESGALQQKVEELRKLADTYKDQFLRKAAEFDNYKRRTEMDFINIVRNANESLLLSLLPIVEDFVRSLKAGSNRTDPEGFSKGVELIFQKLMKVLEAKGLAPFESVGKPFDVGYHDALLQVPRNDVPPQTVIEEVERGYMLNDKVLRHAKVIVSSPAEVPSEQDNVSASGNPEGADTRA